MTRLIQWLKGHKLAVLLFLIILILLAKEKQSRFVNNTSVSYDAMESKGLGAPGMRQRNSLMPEPPIDSGIAPASNVANRMVVQNSHLSLLVKNVSETLQNIKQRAESSGGYMVDSNLSNPQEAATGDITVRIPQTKLDETLVYYRSLGVKVVSENLQGTDVTDQFVDNEERLRILERNKSRMEDIMDRASEISDITSIQQQIFALQNQIDAIKGQQNYLEKTAALSKVTLYLSTDELSLPYAPAEAWRPRVVFQRAVRSLLTDLQGIGSGIIWIGVYGLLIIPIIGVIYIIFRLLRKPPKKV